MPRVGGRRPRVVTGESPASIRPRGQCQFDDGRSVVGHPPVGQHPIPERPGDRGPPVGATERLERALAAVGQGSSVHSPIRISLPATPSAIDRATWAAVAVPRNVSGAASTCMGVLLGRRSSRSVDGRHALDRGCGVRAECAFPFAIAVPAAIAKNNDGERRYLLYGRTGSLRPVAATGHPAVGGPARISTREARISTREGRISTREGGATQAIPCGCRRWARHRRG